MIAFVVVLAPCVASGAAVWADESASIGEPQSNREASSLHTDLDSTSRVDELVEQARAEEWDADELFEFLELGDIDDCRNYADRVYLRERHARWSEAIALLARIAPDELDAWLLGLQDPPEIAVAETEKQLRCLLSNLIEAAHHESYDIRLFLRIHDHFGGRFQSTDELASAIEEQPRWFDRSAQILTRSIFRNIHSQGFIWYRKFRFTGRPFNRVTDEAAATCRLGTGQIWRPENERHQGCWNDHLSPQEREREILQATAAPGLSRHHWGSDVDILGLNPAHFIEGGAFYDDWRWLDDHGLDYGFFQPYGTAEEGVHAHMEERWHWSYYPIGQALWDHVQDNQECFEETLFERWTTLERRWGAGHGPFFGYMREHWRDFLFHIHIPPVDAEPSIDRDDPPVPLP